MKKKSLKILFVLGVSLFVLLCIEIYLRINAAHIEVVPSLKNPDKGWSVDKVFPSYAILKSPTGDRLLPNTNVIIRNHYLSNQDVSIQINNLGFREREISRIKPQNETRVLFLGDSITFGDYLPVEKVYVKRFEYFLKQLKPNKNFITINAGVR